MITCKLFGRIIFSLFILTSLVCTNASNSNELELVSSLQQDQRVAMAKIAIDDHDFKRAYALLDLNITPTLFHLETYKLLGYLHIMHGKYQQALKVYYYIVKKNHGEQLLPYMLDGHLIETIKTIPPASESAKEAYFTIGFIWYHVYQQKKFDTSYQKNILRQARKYFLICHFYNYNYPNTTYYHALVERELGNYYAATEKLFNLKNISDNDLNKLNHDKSTIDFILADSLVRGGNIQAGSSYLKSIYSDSQDNSSIKQYASQYLDSLSINNWGLSVTTGFNYDNNIHDQLLETKYAQPNLPSNDEQTDSMSWLKRANLVYSSTRYGHWSYLFFSNLEENTNTNNKLSIYDTRDILLQGEIKYDTFTQKYFKISYSYGQHYHRLVNEAPFDNLNTKHTITPSSSNTIKATESPSMITWSTPMIFSKDKINNNATFDFGLGLSWKPLLTSQYYAPIYSFLLMIKGREAPYYSSAQFQISFSNLSQINSQTELYMHAEYLISINSYIPLSYKQLTLGPNLLYLIKNIKNLSGQLGVQYQVTDENDTNSFRKWNFFLGLNYSL